MKAWFRNILSAVGMGSASDSAGQPRPKPASSSRFEAGQVWRFRARPHEVNSRVTVGKIETIPKIGTIVHVKLSGLRLKNPHAPGGVAPEVLHIPTTEQALSASVDELIGEAADLEGFADGYSAWLSAYQSEQAGVFTLGLAEIVEHMEHALNP